MQQFSYSAQPHPAPVKHKSKYRDENEENAQLSQNLMQDNRVIRGNTYATKALNNHSNENQVRSSSSAKFPRKTSSKPSSSSRRSSSPPATNGRNHLLMQTTDFLEELTDRPIEQDYETQTQPTFDRPASPLFVRAKIGYDIATQVEPNELFQFDYEVEPLLEVLVGRTLYIAMLEIQQEDELQAIQLQQEEYEMIRNVEIAEVQRLEAEIQRKRQEKERRIQQEQKRIEDLKRLEEVITARQFSNQFLQDLHISVFDVLESQGEFYDPVKREIENNFLSILATGVDRNATIYQSANELMEELLENAKKEARKFEKEAIERREEYKEKIRQAEEEARRKKEEEERIAAELARKAEQEAEEAENPAAEE